jgi:hypothetical protein
MYSTSLGNRGLLDMCLGDRHDQASIIQGIKIRLGQGSEAFKRRIDHLNNE